MSEAKVKLVKYVSEYNYDPDSRKGWALLVRAMDPTNMDSEIFVHHRMAEEDPYEGDLFECIASVNQYYEIPKNKPAIVNEDTIIPYYRKNQFEVFARTLTELQEIWDYVVLDVGRLVSDLNSMKVLNATETREVGSSHVAEYDLGSLKAICTLAWNPAGTWTGDSITEVKLDEKGWLPISEFDNTITNYTESVPSGAKWFYNSAADKDFSSFMKNISEPHEASVLEMNGNALHYTGDYALNSETVFWLDNQSIDSLQKNPWPDDYIDGMPPSYIPTIRLIFPL
jgi:hypothetical protein